MPMSGGRSGPGSGDDRYSVDLIYIFQTCAVVERNEIGNYRTSTKFTLQIGDKTRQMYLGRKRGQTMMFDEHQKYSVHRPTQARLVSVYDSAATMYPENL